MCNRFLCYTSKTDTSLYINSAKSRQSCPTLCDPMDCSPHQTSLFKAFSRQEYWSGLPCPSPGDLPNPGIEHVSPALQTDALPSEPLGKPQVQLLGQEDTLKKGMATHPGYSCLKNSTDRGAWWTTVHCVAQSWTWLSN